MVEWLLSNLLGHVGSTHMIQPVACKLLRSISQICRTRSRHPPQLRFELRQIGSSSPRLATDDQAATAGHATTGLVHFSSQSGRRSATPSDPVVTIFHLEQVESLLCCSGHSVAEGYQTPRMLVGNSDSASRSNYPSVVTGLVIVCPPAGLLPMKAERTSECVFFVASSANPVYFEWENICHIFNAINAGYLPVTEFLLCHLNSGS